MSLDSTIPVTANASQVRILWTSTQTGESWNGYTRTAYYYVSINGGSEVQYSVSYTLPKGSTRTIVDVTLTVNHLADGEGHIRVRTWMDTDISAGVVERSKTLALDTIPRATTPTLSKTSADMGTKVTISLPRASSSFTHDLAYRLSDGGYIVIAAGVGTSYEWTVPDLATHLPESASGNLTIRCTTKNGSSTIGNTYVGLTAKVPTTVRPQVTGVTVEDIAVGIAERFGAPVKGKSRLAVTISAQGAKGSWIKSYSTLFQGKSYQGDSWESEVLTQSGNLSMTVTVKDSRERLVNSYVMVNGVLEYTTPTIWLLRAYRCDASGVAVDDGDRVAIQYRYSAPSLNGGNTVQMRVQYKKSTEETYSTLLESTALSGDTTANPAAILSPDNSYDIKMTVVDYFGAEATTSTRLPSAEVILDVAADGKGLAIGGTSECPGFEVKWTTRLAGRNDQVLPVNTDLNTLMLPNYYAGEANAAYINCPVTTRNFALEVLAAGPAGQLMQRLTTGVQSETITYTRFYAANAWQAWAITGFESTWQTASLTAAFTLYTADQPVLYRRSGGVVEIKGIVKSTGAIAAGADWVTILRLPPEYRPGAVIEVNHICQGGGGCVWLLRITTDGLVQLGIYRSGATPAQITPNDRLPFSVVFLADR